MAGHDGGQEKRSIAKGMGCTGTNVIVVCQASSCENFKRGVGCLREEITLDPIGGCLNYIGPDDQMDYLNEGENGDDN